MPENRPEKSESLRVNVAPAVRQAVRRVAARHDVSEAQVVRWALREYLQKEEESNG